MKSYRIFVLWVPPQAANLLLERSKLRKNLPSISTLRSAAKWKKNRSLRPETKKKPCYTLGKYFLKKKKKLEKKGSEVPKLSAESFGALASSCFRVLRPFVPNVSRKEEWRSEKGSPNLSFAAAQAHVSPWGLTYYRWQSMLSQSVPGVFSVFKIVIAKVTCKIARFVEHP